MKKPGIVIHSLRHSTPTFGLLNDANPTLVQKVMRHQHYATTKIYVEEVQKLLERAEEAVIQIWVKGTLYLLIRATMDHWRRLWNLRPA